MNVSFTALRSFFVYILKQMKKGEHDTKHSSGLFNIG